MIIIVSCSNVSLVGMVSVIFLSLVGKWILVVRNR